MSHDCNLSQSDIQRLSDKDESFDNPLKENLSKQAPPCLILLFGATGDLAKKKIFAALYNMFIESNLPKQFALITFGRRDYDDEKMRKLIVEDIKANSRTTPTEEHLAAFIQQISYFKGEFDEDYTRLCEYMKKIEETHRTEGNRIFYLSVPPKNFLTIVENLSKANMIYRDEEEKRFSRIVIEKPFGFDVETACALQKDLLKHVAERQIFRIDHYLGKETVQNIIAFRFHNAIFEGIMNNHYVDSVQITFAEDLSIGTRGAFYEQTGIFRDVIQNHLFQLMTLIAMEPPASMDANHIRDEKVKVLQSTILFENDQEILENSAVGQYTDGFINGEEMHAYRKEEGVAEDSNIETYAAIKLKVNNWRWSGVPFYLRAGKCLAKRTTEIKVIFKKMPDLLFQPKKQHNANKQQQNALTMRIQPNEAIYLNLNAKVPRQSTQVQAVKMDFEYKTCFGTDIPEAYERLIFDALVGDSTLFARFDESLYSWKILSPVIDYWHRQKLTDINFYPSGSWGPTSADDLLHKDDRCWWRV